jgi:L-alanine-DL-glutamate epimerase-like enolase superfamily enzyme
MAAGDITRIDVSCYRFPTPKTESDATLSWDATTAVAVQVHADGLTGLGWTYSGVAAADVVDEKLKDALLGHRADDTAGLFKAMRDNCRNIGSKGLAMQAISAVDIALWDLKSRLLQTSLIALFGQVRDSVPVYGSGGFTSSTDAELAQDISAWRAAGCTDMKIKIGRHWGSDVQWDLRRVALFRELAGDDTHLMVDANGGYTVGQARRVGAVLDRYDVRWFEEPVSSDDTAGLASVRSAVKCDVAAGEYISDTYDAERLATVVDCLQLDVTRCGGYTGFLQGTAVAHAHNLQVSGHCAPALHASVAAAIPNLRHVEWFNDHARLEPVLVDGVPPVSSGAMHPSTADHGHGMTLAASADDYKLKPLASVLPR